jgi:hypothetical protein
VATDQPFTDPADKVKSSPLDSEDSQSMVKVAQAFLEVPYFTVALVFPFSINHINTKTAASIP